MNDPQNQDPAVVEQGTIQQTPPTARTTPARQTDDDMDDAQRSDAVQRSAAQTTATRPTSTQGTVDDDTGFLPDDRMSALRERWNDVQAGFVDDPQNAVQQAHGLVTQLVDDLVQTFSQERTSLETQWKSGGDADTEQLRVALQRYRSFFNRLLGT